MSGLVVCEGAQLKCSLMMEGIIELIVIPTAVTCSVQAVATDLNAMPSPVGFGMCSSPCNPEVEALMALGVDPAEVPCTPIPDTPWENVNEKIRVSGGGGLTSHSTINCLFKGKISIIEPAQATVFAG